MKMQTDFYSLSKNAPPNFFFLYSVIQSDCKKKSLYTLILQEQS